MMFPPDSFAILPPPADGDQPGGADLSSRPAPQALPRKRGLAWKTDTFRSFVLGPLERITNDLNRGEPMDEDSVKFLHQYIAKAEALKAALKMREDMEAEVIE